MQLDGARTLVVGATGVLGSRLAAALRTVGARLVLTGRDPQRLAAVGAELDAPTVALDLLDMAACAAAVDRAAAELGGLDLVLVATGVAAFGHAAETSDAVAEELFAVNTLGPLTVCRAAVPVLAAGGGLAVLSAVLADQPMAGMAAYSASKAGLSAYLTALRRELRRRRITVLDVKPPHLETGLAERALAGEPPRLPAGYDIDALVALVLRGLAEDAREVAVDGREVVLR